MRSGLLAAGWITLVGLAFAGSVLLSGLQFWPFELVHHFTLHYLFSGAILTFVFLVLRRRVAAAFSAILVLLFAGFSWSGYNGLAGGSYASVVATGHEQGPNRSLTVITHNVHDANERHPELRAWLGTEPADLVMLQEVPYRQAALYREEGIYPRRLEIFDPTLNHPNFPDDKGLVILSRYPISKGQAFRPFDRSRPIAIVRVSVPDAGDIWAVSVDAWDPKTAANLVNRDRLLLGIAQKLSELDGPVVVAGDFNATPFTPVFGEFLQLAKLSPPQSPVATYPAVLGWLGLPIDHILVRNVRIDDVKALDPLGSDHRPLKATLTIPN